ncbi:MAG: ABC transporter substrate-binding protein [Thaumarchaeota archaeon]|nr:ABC transporter substrate-binding protein [Nitrososphaerota archaeon]
MKILVYSGVAAAVIVIAIASMSLGQPESDENQVRLVFFANVNHAVPIVGLENGEFAKELGNTAIKTRMVDSGPEAVEALFTKSADLAYLGPAPLVIGYVKSKTDDIKILAGATSGGASFVIQKDSAISTAADLDGKKIAAPFIGNTQDVSLRYYLTENNLKSKERGGTVTIYNIANPEIYTLFAKGDIDAAWVPEPTATMLVEQLGGKRLFKEEDTWPDKKFASVLLVARTEFLEKHPDLVAKWIDAHTSTVNWIKENPDETESIFIDFYKKHTGKKLSKDIVHGAFSNIVITSDPIPNSISIFAERANDLGYLGRSGYNLDNIYYDYNKTRVESWQN